MKCHVEGCDRDADYKKQQVCQKHYFRFMRTGSYKLKERKRQYRRQNPAGYFRLWEPDHPLADSLGVYEHRFVVYQEYGENLPDCEICGKPTDWGSCHIDHINNDVTDNRLENLRPVCRPCNTLQGRRPEHEYDQAKHKITIDGVTGTAAWWSRQPGVKVSSTCIRQRKRRGMSDYHCVYAAKVTHKEAQDA